MTPALPPCCMCPPAPGQPVTPPTASHTGVVMPYYRRQSISLSAVPSPARRPQTRGVLVPALDQVLSSGTHPAVAVSFLFGAKCAFTYHLINISNLCVLYMQGFFLSLYQLLVIKKKH